MQQNQGTMEELMKKKCEEYGYQLDWLTAKEKAELQKEIEAEQRGENVLDSVLDNPEIHLRGEL